MSVEAIMLWNEPNNLSHWDREQDPGWERFASMVKLASAAVRAENPRLRVVLGGISPIDPDFISLLARQGVMDAVDVVAVHG
ncbi:MAG TPA: beta-xylosidase, partial [Polyangiaceae bacterium]|nr:beta-xylosidase [Polyangiaceae bacterium]